MPLNGSIRMRPRVAPSKDNSSDSSMKEVRMLGRENPITRSVAISRPRYATAAYMVLAAAKHDPTAMMKATIQPTILIGPPDLVCEA